MTISLKCLVGMMFFMSVYAALLTGWVAHDYLQWDWTTERGVKPAVTPAHPKN